MPFFTEGEDPRDQPGINPAGRMPYGAPPPDPFAGPTQEEAVSAAFRQSNPVVSVLDAISRGSPENTPVPGYSPVARLSGTTDDDLIEQSLGDVNPAQTDARIAKKNAEIKDQQTLAASGWFGTVASVAAGATDPSWFIPIAGELRAGEAGLSVAARVAHGMIEGAVKSAVSETALQASQVTRTPTETGANIATNTLLMGLLGGGLAMLSPAERARARAGLDETRADLSTPRPAAEPAAPAPAAAGPIDATHDVVSGANSAKDPNGPVFVDRRIPQFSPTLKDGAGQPADLWKYLAIHERTEAHAEAGGMSYGNAHTSVATPAERAAVEADGVSWKAYTDEIDGYLDHIEHEHPENPPGVPLHVDPEAAIGHHRSSNKQAEATPAPAAPQPELPFHDQESIVPHETPEPATLGSDLSAASSDARSMQLSRIMLPDNAMHALKQVPVVGGAINWTGKVLMKFSPNLRVFSSASLVAKRAMGDMVDTALRFTQADQGITTARGGVTVERLVKQQKLDGEVRANRIMTDQFIAHRGLEDAKLPTAQAAVQDLRGQTPAGKMTWDDFNTAVSGAMTNGDVHPVPQVAAAAKQIRSQVFDPVTLLAQRTMGPDGKPMLAEALEPPKGDKSFFPRIWNKQAIAANYNAVKKTFADWLESEQGIKAAAKERLTGLQKELQDAQAAVGNAKDEDAMVAATTRHDAVRARIEKEIADWHGTTTNEAKAAMKAREKYRADREAESKTPGEKGRLTSADSAVDGAVDAIMKSDRDLSRSELEDRAKEIVNRINSGPNGRLNYDVASGGPVIGPPGEQQQVRAALNSREFAIPTSLVKDYVHTDVQHVVSSHLRTALPDIHLTDRFGDVEMTQTFKNLNDEYDRRIGEAKTEKKQVKLDRERKAMERDIAATRDRLRGVYGATLTPTQENMARVANAARNYNVITDLGTSVINRLFDSVNAVARHGLMNVFGDGYLPFFKSMVGMDAGAFKGAALQGMKDASVGVDAVSGHMAQNFGDVMDNYLPGSKFERAIGWAAQKAMMVNLHAQWTDAIKTVGGTVAGASFLRAAERIAAGTHTPEDIAQMAQAGIEPAMATRIWKSYQDGGGQEFGTGTHVANTADWKDAGARDVFRAAVGRDADMSVLTPGIGEKPLWMSDQIFALLGQYKSFIAAAHEKVLIANLQQMDGRTLQGLVAAVGMGMLSYRLYTLVSGQQVSDRPQDWIKEGVTRSPIFGWITEINQMQAKFTGGSTDMFRAIGADHPLSRRQSNSALSELLGPTYSKMEGIAGGVNDAFHGSWTAMDSHKLRQAMPLQNLFAIRKLLDSAEDGFNEKLGVKPLNRDPSQWPTH